MRRCLLRSSVCAAVIAAWSGTAAAQQPPPSPVPAPRDPTDTNRPRQVPGFDASAIDRSVNPCNDFYQFTCGGWLARNPVPPDRARWGRFAELAERNLETLHQILEKTAALTATTMGSRRSGIHSREAAGGSGGRDYSAPQLNIDRQIGDYYTSCMDEAAIEAKGLAPLQEDLDAIARLKSKAELPALVARLHGEGVAALFRYGSLPDFKDSTMYIAGVDQGGLGLPDRDYYLKDEERFAKVRQDYVPHVRRMLELLGETPEAAARDAETVLQIETALAKAALDRVRRRDPANLYHKVPRAQLASFAPAFDWNAYFAAAASPQWSELNVTWPEFFTALGGLFESRSLDDLKTYLRWHLVHDAAGLLPARFVNENFEFYGRTLTGAKELRPRWKRCVSLVDDQLGEALGQRYVEATFGAEGKERTARMVAALETALGRDIRELPWMTEATKKRAAEKLAAIANKIGYPEHWIDYSTVRIVRGDALGNAHRAKRFEEARDIRKIGTRVDPSEWGITPPTVNAYYSALENNINFPAGILQPPFFEKTMDDAVNFGAIGAVIGHELTHGFDDQGRKFDPRGNLADWWTEEDAKEFQKRVSCVADQYSQYTVAGDVHVNGRLTLGENVADNGGVRIARMALMDTLEVASAPLVDGFTPEQRVFLGWGQIWCENETEQAAKLRVQTDPHSPGRYRVNGVVSNMPEFQKAFSCPAAAPMVRENACRVW
jgi:endothelin-converting enzyme/putative endopeptidase